MLCTIVESLKLSTMNNFSKTLEQDLLELGYHSVNFYDDYMNEAKPENCTEISILTLDGGCFDIKTVKPIPKKKFVDVEYIVNRIEAKSVYTSFASDFKELLLSEYPNFRNSINVYPTTYGIGVFVAFGLRGQLKETLNQIETLLNKYKIDFSTGRSNAGYVFRFLISKKKENINKIKLTTKNT